MSKILAALAAAATSVLVGAAIVATRFVIDQTAPASLALWRYLIGLCCLLPPVLLIRTLRETRIHRRDVLPIALLGVTQFGILIALLNYALQSIPAARAALIFATMPLLTMLIAAALGQDRLSVVRSLGVLLTIVGVGLVLADKALRPPAAPSGLLGDVVGRAAGDWAAFASALCGAACSVLYRPYLRKYPTLPVSALAMFASVGFLAVVAAGEGLFEAAPDFTSHGWLAVLFIGVSSGIGYYLWLWALNHTTATQVTVFLALSPLTAAALGAMLLDESISPLFLIALGCVILGLALAHWRASVPTGSGARLP